MSVYSENHAVIAGRFPEVARRLAGAPNLPVALRDDEDAQWIAARWLEGRRVRRGGLIAVSGFGDGTHLRLLLTLLPAGSRVFAAEALPGAFRSVLEQRDLSDILRDPRLILGVGEVNDAFFEALPSSAVLELTDVEAWVFAPCFNAAPEYYARFLTEFARFVDFRRKLEGTRVVDAAIWQANSFANLAALADAPEIHALGQVFRGRPMVLVSAGPSLDESLDFLRAASRVAVIVAVNSSYRAVRNAGVVPHLVLAADPREYTARGFAGVPVDGTWLVTTPIVHPDVVRMFAGRTFIWSGSNELFAELRHRLGMQPGIRIVEQGTVSACAIDLGVIMGCDRICLVGQDLAIRADGRSHAADSFYTDLNANQADTSSCRRLPGNTLPEVLVESKLYVYLKTFEQLAAARPQATFRNTSRLGARIEGIPYLPLDQALAWLGTKSSAGAAEALAKRHRTGGEWALGRGRSRDALARTPDYARDVLRLALRAAALFEALVDERLDEEQGRLERFAPALAATEELRRMLEGNPAEYGLLEGGQTRLELFKARSFERAGPPAGASAEAFRFLAEREYTWAIAEGAWFLLNQLERALAIDTPSQANAKTP